MIGATVLENETARLNALKQFYLLDTEPENEFNHIVALAAQLCDAPIALITLIDQNRQWFKAKYGLNVVQMPRNGSFCEQTIAHKKAFIVTDAANDPHFANNPFVTHHPHSRFYAGVPLITQSGYAIGTLCVLDTKPRQLLQPQQQNLEMLAIQVMALLNSRLQVSQLKLEMLRVNRLYSFISHTNQMVIRTKDRSEIFRHACSIAIEFGKFRMAWIGILNTQTHELEPFAWDGFVDGYLTKVKELSKQYNNNQKRSPSTRAIREKKTAYSNDLANDPNFTVWRNEAIQRNYASAVGLPIIVNNNIIGTFNIYADEPHFFNASEIQLLEEVTGNIAYALEKIENEEKRIKAEEAIKAEHNLLRTLINTLPDAIYTKDTEARKKIANPVDIKNIGFVTETDIIGKTDLELFPGELGQRGYNVDRKVIESGVAILNLEEDFTFRDGKKRWMLTSKVPLRDASGTVIGLMGIGRNITDRKEAEEKLRLSERMFRDLVKNVPGFVFQFRIKKGELPYFSYISEQANAIFNNGVPFEKTALQWGFLKYVHKEDRIPVYDSVKSSIKNHKDWSFDGRIITANNEIKWFQAKAIPVFIKNELVYNGIIEDITNRKTNEIELQKSFNLISKQNERLINFSYIVSHNLRSHTSNIIAITRIIETLDNEEERKEMLDFLKNASSALNETLQNLNDVIAIQNNIDIATEPLSLTEYIGKAQKVLTEQIVTKNVLIQNHIPGHVVVNHNPAYLESIVLNFLSNAIKYSHPKRQPIVTLNYTHKNNLHVLEISDNGIGIDLKKNGNKLFGMYKTFTSNPDSRGIGLFITKNQIEALGGSVTVTSQLNEGTCFNIYFK